jgi:hypothetical protein
MRGFSSHVFKGLLAPVLALGLAAGCTKYNPSTGQQEIDYGATAGVAGAAMGAAALGVALSNNDDDRYYYGGPGYYGGRGGNYRGPTNVNVDRSVHVNKASRRNNAYNHSERANRVNANRANVNAGNRPNMANRPRPNGGGNWQGRRPR